jgi:hypothetical protein
LRPLHLANLGRLTHRRGPQMVARVSARRSSLAETSAAASAGAAPRQRLRPAVRSPKRPPCRGDPHRRGAVVPRALVTALVGDLPLLSHGHLRASSDSLGMRGRRVSALEAARRSRAAVPLLAGAIVDSGPRATPAARPGRERGWCRSRRLHWRGAEARPRETRLPQHNDNPIVFRYTQQRHALVRRAHEALSAQPNGAGALVHSPWTRGQR